MNTGNGPISDYLDELLRRTRSDAHSARRLLEDAAEHLHTVAEELEHAGLSRVEAELEAVRRFGPATPIARATSRRSLAALVIEATRAALFLGACGLIAIGVSGLVALAMNAALGRSFVGGPTTFPGNGTGPLASEVADDAVVLRVIAGFVGLIALLGYSMWRRLHPSRTILPAGLVDALGAAAFAAATVGLAAIAANQSHPARTPGVGFALSGALVALPAAVIFAGSSVRQLLPARR